jgi:hypothetical protein
MATYVVSEIDYWGGAPRIKFSYVGQDRMEAINEFDECFKRSCWNPDKNEWFMIPQKVVKEVGEDPSYETVLKYLIREMDDDGNVEIDSDWDDGEGDYPLYLRFIKVDE